MSLASRPRSSRAALLAAGLVALLGGVAAVGVAPAAARGPDAVPRPGTPQVLATGLDVVFSMAVRDRRTVAVTGFGPVRLVSRGTVSTLVPELTEEQVFWFNRFDGLSWDGDRLYLTAHGQVREMALSEVYLRTPDGVVTPVADVGESGHEDRSNPDAVQTYGYLGGLPDECASQFFWENPWEQYGIVYQGMPNSGPVQTAVRRGVLYLADALANDVLVDDGSGVRTLAVLPPMVATMTAEAPGAQEQTPECALGHPYAYEATPTDIEVGRDGDLYVTTLSGGARGPDGQPLGRVYRVDPGTGALTVRADGLDRPRELALGPRGEIYVADRSGVTVVPRGGSTPQPFLALADVTTLEVEGKALYLTTSAGELLRVPLRR